MAKGHVYLVAIMDWYSKAVLSWALSNSMDAIIIYSIKSETASIKLP